MNLSEDVKELNQDQCRKSYRNDVDEVVVEEIDRKKHDRGPLVYRDPYPSKESPEVKRSPLLE